MNLHLGMDTKIGGRRLSNSQRCRRRSPWRSHSSVGLIDEPFWSEQTAEGRKRWSRLNWWAPSKRSRIFNHRRLTHHKTETVIGDDGDEDEQEQSDAEAGSDEGIRYSNNATANDGIYIIKRCLGERWEGVVDRAAELLVLREKKGVMERIGMNGMFIGFVLLMFRRTSLRVGIRIHAAFAAIT